MQGCIAGGRHYLHINANGDVEPCAFVHYSNVNIKDCSLIEALQSPLFMEYYKGQPWNENHLRPCPVLDNPEKIKQAVERSGAHSTEMLAPESVDDLIAKNKALCRKVGACCGYDLERYGYGEAQQSDCDVSGEKIETIAQKKSS